MNLPGFSRLSLRGRILLLALVSFVSVTSALVLYLLATLFAPTVPNFTPRRTIPLTDINPYGANFFLEREVEAWKRERTVSMARSAGIGWARQEFVWEEIEPSPGVFNWSKYDDLVALLLRNHIQVIARLDRPPAWARTNASGTGSSGPPDDFEKYGDFVEAFARHYRGQIYFFQIWNEPNLAREWNDAPIDPAAYARLLKIAYTRAKSVDPNFRILTAPLAITLGELFSPDSTAYRNMNDLQFLEEMYAAGGNDSFDILSANAFGLGSPPDDPPNPGKLNFQRVLLERAVMEKFGDTNKPVWINEYGWNAAPPTMPDSRLIWGRVTEEQQADYTVRGIEYARKNWQWAGVTSIWFFRQVGDISVNNPEYYFRMVDADFTPRPVYVRVRQAAGNVQLANPGEYEDTNPALEYTGAWSWHFDPRASGDEETIASAEGARAILRFYGEALDLLVRKSADAGRLKVLIDGQSVTKLPRGADGATFIDLADASENWQVQIPVARGLRRGEHTVELTGMGKVNLDGFIVPAIAPSSPPWVALGAFVILGMGSLLGLLRELRRGRLLK